MNSSQAERHSPIAAGYFDPQVSANSANRASAAAAVGAPGFRSWWADESPEFAG